MTQNQNLNEVSVLQSWIQFYLSYTWNFFNGSHIWNIAGMFLEQKGLEMVTIINCYGLRAFDGSSVCLPASWKAFPNQESWKIQKLKLSLY